MQHRWTLSIPVAGVRKAEFHQHVFLCTFFASHLSRKEFTEVSRRKEPPPKKTDAILQTKGKKRKEKRRTYIVMYYSYKSFPVLLFYMAIANIILFQFVVGPLTSFMFFSFPKFQKKSTSISFDIRQNVKNRKCPDTFDQIVWF